MELLTKKVRNANGNALNIVNLCEPNNLRE